MFARIEGTLPAPESSHAIRVAIDEALKCKETGEEKTVTRKELKTRTVEGEYIYSLRYDEFIAPLICMVQKQQKQIENLERRLSALENKEEAK